MSLRRLIATLLTLALFVAPVLPARTICACESDQRTCECPGMMDVDEPRESEAPPATSGCCTKDASPAEDSGARALDTGGSRDITARCCGGIGLLDNSEPEALVPVGAAPRANDLTPATVTTIDDAPGHGLVAGPPTRSAPSYHPLPPYLAFSTLLI